MYSLGQLCEETAESHAESSADRCTCCKGGECDRACTRGWEGLSQDAQLEFKLSLLFETCLKRTKRRYIKVEVMEI